MKRKFFTIRLLSSPSKRIVYAFLFFFTWSSSNVSAESVNNIVVQQNSQQNDQVAVSGVVTDESGEPLIGVSVKAVGTTTGTVTDFDGKFSLKVPNASSVLEFSYIGFGKKQVKVGSNTTLKVVMTDDAHALGPVVVTALGMKRSEKALGYSVTELSGDELSKNAVNPVASLQGKVAGVEVSGTDGGLFGSTKIQIRGASTLKGNNQPIYVVDGVILENGANNNTADWDADANDYGNALKNLNSDDFETITVLKGAPATALYGSRGLNGAVVITTKGGGVQKGFGVSVTQSLGLDIVTSTPNRQNTYGPGVMSGWVNYGQQVDGIYNRWDNTGQFALNSSGTPSLAAMESAGWGGMFWGPRFDGSSIELYDQTMGSYNSYKNNYKDAFRTAFNTNTNVVVKGGNEKMSFYNSLSYKYAEGTVSNNSFSRISNLLKATYKISDRVDIAGSVTISTSTPKNPAINIGEYYSQSLGPSYNTNYYKDKYNGDFQNGIASSDQGDQYAYVPGKNLWFRLANNTDIQKEFNARPTLNLNVKIQDWVQFKAEGNMDYYSTRREVKRLGTGFDNKGNNDGTGGYYLLSNNERRQETLAGTFTFSKDLNDFSLGGFVRGEYFNTEGSSTSTNTSGGLISPGQYFLANSRNPINGSASIYGRKRMLSAVFAANIGWKNQLFLDITGRNDWSSSLVYTNGTGNYSYFYPSLTGSWIISETFKELPRWISFAKVRASWAQVGNDTDAYYINQGFTNNSLLQSNGSSIYLNNVPTMIIDKDLKPERKNAIEFGLDWRFLNNRIGIDATYYKENTKDQIMSIGLASETGVGSQLINAGNIQNEGVEIGLKTVPFVNKDWEWTVDLTYTKNVNKIIELHPNVGDYFALDGDITYGNFRIGSVAKVGGEYGMLMTDSKPLKDENGQYVLTWSDTYRYARQTRSGEIEEIGTLSPKFLGSLSTALKYKDFTLRVGLDMRYGGWMASYSNRYSSAYGLSESSLRYRDPEHGGITWTSQYADSKGMTFHDGMIPDGVFAAKTVVTTPGGTKQDVSGLSYREAYEKGYVEPVHASAWTYYQNSWGQGVINDDWVSEVKYIALREISIGYRVPRSFSSKFGAQNLNLMFTARNLGYLYNSLPNGLNPESIRGNTAAAFRERGYAPVTSSFLLTIGVDF